ncbi:MAG: DUF3467 domain-containing protein [Zetaproteobacteria bacterium CG12_big_fil_rev_8_21_14_0_65_54_13]|nr:MAG: hypothetical protein COX55_03115 [Zetaproteobacteria bacterium CG23_combo_of_CG06-09_8_20_14_all_54_7]PIW49674.1 MAG: DUF3467 domain-containing protein [Zetaproteobacteria bacterium CG12_big_fil_rev_8_21_14_0_65_54_13]PIX53974.1 MAG: DUF3467 domain-containing protein [Zetaproteobacteria bacterium CG_4_10_14_3_um_filter_54_28]PJA28154.1 MAG: DUF3467 domain-containing protein [Zetaproteobacteria bacterium CG_4_9_14_3_um_filter_54_145]
MDNNNAEHNDELQIQLPQEVQRGVYANQMMLSHTREEFVLDFILATPPVGLVNARVLVSPSHARRIVTALQENIGRYEAVHGAIEPANATILPASNNQPLI